MRTDICYSSPSKAIKAYFDHNVELGRTVGTEFSALCRSVGWLHRAVSGSEAELYTGFAGISDLTDAEIQVYEARECYGNLIRARELAERHVAALETKRRGDALTNSALTSSDSTASVSSESGVTSDRYRV